MDNYVVFFLKNKQFFHIFRKYFTFVTESYTFKMARMFLLLVPKCKKKINLKH